VFVGQADYTSDFRAMGLNTMVSNITVSHISIKEDILGVKIKPFLGL